MHSFFLVTQANHVISETDPYIRCLFVFHFLLRVYKKEIRRATKNRQTAYGGGEWLYSRGEQHIFSAIFEPQKAGLDKV